MGREKERNKERGRERKRRKGEQRVSPIRHSIKNGILFFYFFLFLYSSLFLPLLKNFLVNQEQKAFLEIWRWFHFSFHSFFTPISLSKWYSKKREEKERKVLHDDESGRFFVPKKEWKRRAKRMEKKIIIFDSCLCLEHKNLLFLKAERKHSKMYVWKKYSKICVWKNIEWIPLCENLMDQASGVSMLPYILLSILQYISGMHFECNQKFWNQKVWSEIFWDEQTIGQSTTIWLLQTMNTSWYQNLTDLYQK